jgi:peptide/nickel transport system ATP-binding protein
MANRGKSLLALREELRVAILFISHNLSLVASLCAEVAVLYAGRLVETGSVRDVFRDPLHPYTRGLLRCVPRMSATKDHARLLPMAGALPAAGAALPGCQFAPRCPIAETACAQSEPELRIVKAGRAARCFFPDKREVTEMAARNTVSAVRAPGPPLMEVTGLSKSYADTTACDEVSLHVAPGEILGLVGESGSGKTTLVRCIAGLVQPDAGELAFGGSRLAWRVGWRDREAMRRLQMVFQNPDSTLNPRQGVRYTISRAIRKLGGTRSVNEVASAVRLDAHHLQLRASELSGGQRQRVAIARAFAGNPKLVLCDEPVSALDVSVQATILNLLADVAERERVAYIFISHDLSVVHYLADRIAVMYLV